jgi:23S rRNA pseudouridine2604 synthase
MSEQGICSRREADRYIELGQVLVDGAVVSELGTKVPPHSHITLNKQGQARQSSKITILLNKPIGYVSTQPEKGYPAAVELIRPENYFGKNHSRFIEAHAKHLGVAGRLDIDSKGLLVLSQDGALVKKIIGPFSDVEKEYLVEVEGNITKQTLQKLTFGLSLDGKPLKRIKVEQIKPQLLRMVLKEGKNRQIRRMCEQVHLKVLKLKRVRVGDYCLGALPEGKWCYAS